MNRKIKELRSRYNDYFDLRMSNQDELERLKKKLNFEYSILTLTLLDEKKKYDQELKSELLSLDEEILQLSKIKQAE